jgi:hypothetical protein
MMRHGSQQRYMQPWGHRLINAQRLCLRWSAQAKEQNLEDSGAKTSTNYLQASGRDKNFGIRMKMTGGSDTYVTNVFQHLEHMILGTYPLFSGRKPGVNGKG